jgi:hypothetical protein
VYSITGTRLTDGSGHRVSAASQGHPQPGPIGVGKHTGAVGPGTGDGSGSPGPGRLEDINAGGLDPAKVAARIKNQYFRGVKQCYDRTARGRPNLGGRVDVRFVIGPDGKVQKANVDGFDPGVDACIQGQARNWKFDRPAGGSAEFSIPFMLRPEG